MDKEKKEKFKKWWVKNAGKLEGTDVFLSLFTEGYKEDYKCLAELGLAIMLDKPIALLVEKGTKVPENLKKIAIIEEYFGEKGLKDATDRMMEKLRERN